MIPLDTDISRQMAEPTKLIAHKIEHQPNHHQEGSNDQDVFAGLLNHNHGVERISPKFNENASIIFVPCFLFVPNNSTFTI